MGVQVLVLDKYNSLGFLGIKKCIVMYFFFLMDLILNVNMMAKS